MHFKNVDFREFTRKCEIITLRAYEQLNWIAESSTLIITWYITVEIQRGNFHNENSNGRRIPLHIFRHVAESFLRMLCA